MPDTEQLGVDALVNQLQAEETAATTAPTFAPPPRPAFIADESPELDDDDDGVVDEEVEESSPKAKGAHKPMNAEFYADGEVSLISMAMAIILGWLNDGEPEEYEIDPFQRKELVAAKAAMIEESGKHLSPKQRFYRGSALVWGPDLFRGIRNKWRTLSQWWKDRKAKKAAPKPTQAEDKPTDSVTISREEAERMYADMLETARKEAAEERAKKAAPDVAKNKPIQADKPETSKAHSDSPTPTPIDTTAITPPPLAELQKKLNDGLCLFPGCNQKTKGKFCGNPHKNAYTIAHNRLGSKWISTKNLKAQKA